MILLITSQRDELIDSMIPFAREGLAKHRTVSRTPFITLFHLFLSRFFLLVPTVCTGNYQRTKYVARKTLISNDVAADSANRGS